MIKAIIVDDELSCRESLKNIVHSYISDVNIIDTASSVDAAYEKILLLKPDLVFLDILMPPADGFVLLNKFKNRNFEVIFTTAHNQYALQAIKHSALDYILKPVNVMELVDAVEKVKDKFLQRTQHQQPVRISVPTKESLVFLEPSLIIHAESELGHKTAFYLKNNKRIVANRDLVDYEQVLIQVGFFRSHRSHIINWLEVKEYVSDRNGGCVIMTDGKLVPIAAKKKDEFLGLFK